VADARSMTTPTTLDATTAAPRPHGRGLDLVAPRPLLTGPIDVAFRLTPGDRPLVATGDAIVAGTAIAQRIRDPRVVDMPALVDRRGGDRKSVV